MNAIGIFCGGFSSEFHISMQSAETIVKHFPNQYTPILIKISRGKWECEWNESKGEFDLNTASVRINDQKIKLQGALIYIHGDPGENGKLQAYLELFNIPYVNSGVLPSALSFDKWYCNQFLKSFEVPVAKSVLLNQDTEVKPDQLVQELGLPIFVKPTASGSSYGITKVKEVANLTPAIQKAFKESNLVVLESFLDGVEVTCGVFRGTKGLVALPLTEIQSENEYFDYEAKYLGKSKEITPARIPIELTQTVQSMAKKVYQLLDLRSIARIDFMIVHATPYVIEVNTTPGFSSESIVPKMLAEAKISIADFWEEVFAVELIKR
ncbi:MAG: D-alanine--D-alanine ligase [Flavobacteriia bacterium]|nr:D-alanine--D-alanine ligase [Flavobacteriia bacterium]